MITVADVDLMNHEEWRTLNKWVESLEGGKGDKDPIEKAKRLVVDMLFADNNLKLEEVNQSMTLLKEYKPPKDVAVILDHVIKHTTSASRTPRPRR